MPELASPTSSTTPLLTVGAIRALAALLLNVTEQDAAASTVDVPESTGFVTFDDLVSVSSFT